MMVLQVLVKQGDNFQLHFQSSESTSFPKYRILRIIRPRCIIRPFPSLAKVMWKGIYIYSIHPPSTAGLLPLLEMMTAGKWQIFHM